MILNDIPIDLIKEIMFILSYDSINLALTCKNFLIIFKIHDKLLNKLFELIYDKIPRNLKYNILEDAILLHNLLKPDVFKNEMSPTTCIVFIKFNILKRCCNFISSINNHDQVIANKLQEKFDSYFNDPNTIAFIFYDLEKYNEHITIFDSIRNLNNESHPIIFFISKPIDERQLYRNSYTDPQIADIEHIEIINNIADLNNDLNNDFSICYFRFDQLTSEEIKMNFYYLNQNASKTFKQKIKYLMNIAINKI